MSDEQDERAVQPLLTMRPWLRRLATLIVLALAVTHLLRPDWAIDAVFLGLIAFAAFIWLFDVESIEFQGIRAKRREIARAKVALEESSLIDRAMVPVAAPTPPQQSATAAAPQDEGGSGIYDLDAPTNQFERLVWAVEQIRIELIVLAGNSGRLVRRKPWGDYQLSELVDDLRPANVLSEGLIQAIRTVSKMRNTAVHTLIVDPASDLAMEVVQSLRSIHRFYIRVREPDVPVYRDESLTTPHSFRGVIIVMLDEARKAPVTMVYPREGEYARGRFVTWEWKIRGTDEEAWYIDPTTKRAAVGWSQSAIFVGREYPEQWGLEFRLPRPDFGLD